MEASPSPETDPENRVRACGCVDPVVCLSSYWKAAASGLTCVCMCVFEGLCSPFYYFCLKYLEISVLSYTCLLSLRAGLSASESLSLAFCGSVSDPGLSSFSSSPCVAVSPLCQPLGSPFLSPPCSLSHPFRTGLWAGGFPTLAPDPLTNLHLVFPLQAGDEPQCPYELWTPGPMLLGKVR